MKKLLNNPWFVTLLAVVALGVVANSVLSGGQDGAWAGGPVAGNDPAVIPGETEATGEEAARLPVDDALKALESPKHAARDPFARRRSEDETGATDEKTVVPDLLDSAHLSALWTQDGITYSLINDRICRTGDMIGRLKLESATQEGIWLSHWKGRDFVALGGEFILRTPAGHTAL